MRPVGGLGTRPLVGCLEGGKGILLGFLRGVSVIQLVSGSTSASVSISSSN